MNGKYDLLIIGAGPAGLTAAIYAARAKLKTAVCEKEREGGNIVNSDMVENFPGFPNGISGSELASNLLSQVMQYEVEFIRAQVEGLEVRNDLKWVRTPEGDYAAGALILAGGAKPKKLGIPGEEEFAGTAVFACAMCDGNRFPGQEIAIIGGGDGGITEGLYMTRIASQVTIIEILPQLRAARVLQERARANPKMKILCSTTVEAIQEAGARKNLCLKNVVTGEKADLRVSGIFIVAGLEPQTEYLKGVVDLAPDGFVVVRPSLETSVPGIFAAGDIRCGSARQAVTAAGDGAAAALAAERYLAVNPQPRWADLDY
jgi:thioredoxin reductase (NADPH)